MACTALREWGQLGLFLPILVQRSRSHSWNSLLGPSLASYGSAHVNSVAFAPRSPRVAVCFSPSKADKSFRSSKAHL